ncbi:hypothetical protein AAC387_Pa10g2098 [Persea americana]
MLSELPRGLLFIWILAAISMLNVHNSQGRTHFHKKKSHGSKSAGPVPQPPAYYPTPSPPDSSGSGDSSPDGCSFDVRSYGAVGDGSTDDTDAFKLAWKDACASESAVLLVPSDYNFMITSTIFSGPCKRGLVFQGPNGSTLPGPCDSPALIRFFMSSNLVLSNLRIQNSPQFHVKFDGCSNVLIQSISIDSPALSPNTDGIHVEGTKSVSIYNSEISNGDDCVSIGPGCSDVNIENVICEHSHGISIGSLGVHNSQACVSNIMVSNAVIRNSDNGVRIKTWQGGMGSVTGITFDSIVMENVRNCIIIDQYYCLKKECLNQTSAVFVSDVSYTNIKGTYDVRSPPIHFACSDTVPCANITMSEVELLPAQGELVDDPFCWNAYGALQTLTIPPITCLQDGAPLSIKERSKYDC